MPKFNPRIEASRLTNGKLPKFTSVGSYPLMYVTADGFCLCADCTDALDALADNTRSVSMGVNWGSATKCDDCDAVIEGAG